MRLENDIKLDFSDVLIRPKRSTLKSRKDVDLLRTYKFKNSGRTYTGIPIMAANMYGVGTMEMAKALSDYSLFTCLHKFHTLDQLNDFRMSEIGTSIGRYAYSLGTSNEDLDKFKSLKIPPSYVCIDVANGYTETFVDFVAKFRSLYPNMVIIAGNVVTGEMTEELILNGADIVKVGIGPGSVCTTRIKTGVGYPQLSAIIECADAAHGLGGHIIGDGGCTNPGDVAKAFGAGADFVMLGSMLAGHKEGGNVNQEITSIELDQTGQTNAKVKSFVEFHGMSSKEAMDIHYGGKADYRAAEGKSVKIPYKGEVKDTVEDILGGLRSTCTYTGASTLKQLSKCTTFIRVNNTHNRIFE